MDREPLSPIQAEVLSAIRRRVHEGEPVPSYRELCDEFGWKSTGTVRDHLQALARKGHIELSGPGHRRIRLLADQLAVARVPLIGRVSAGSPVVAENNVERHLPVPVDWLGSGVYYAVRMEGDSMVDAGILEGDYIIVRQQNVANDGEFVLITVDAKMTVKRYERRGTQVISRSEDDRPSAIPLETESAIVHGVVVGLMRAYHDRGLTHRSPHRVGGALPRGPRRRAEGE